MPTRRAPATLVTGASRYNCAGLSPARATAAPPPARPRAQRQRARPLPRDGQDTARTVPKCLPSHLAPDRALPPDCPIGAPLPPRFSFCLTECPPCDAPSRSCAEHLNDQRLIDVHQRQTHAEGHRRRDRLAKKAPAKKARRPRPPRKNSRPRRLAKTTAPRPSSRSPTTLPAGEVVRLLAVAAGKSHLP